MPQLWLMKPIVHHTESRITRKPLNTQLGTVNIFDPLLREDNLGELMLTSPRTNGTDHFVPSHNLALLTQPVLGARSRSRKQTTNVIVETSNKDKLDSMISSRRNSCNDSPPLILPINRVDTSQYQKKNATNSYHESSDSGVDLSLSTNSSVQFQPYPAQHISSHRPLSALNEDSNTDDGFHDEQKQMLLAPVRLRCPPVSFGRNRSMEDMLNNNTRDEQKHRSSSFSDEQQKKLPVSHDTKKKRSSDGILLDLVDTLTNPMESYGRTNIIKSEYQCQTNFQQHRSLNDLNNKMSYKALTIHNESTMPPVINNTSTTHTVIRKPNASTTLKPLRKKTKLTNMIEPSVPLASSRLIVCDEPTNPMAGATSSSSNQTTPRSTRPLCQYQQQPQKPKARTQLSHYPNQEQIRAHVNRSVIERQHPTNLVIHSRHGAIQQTIPFDASPSKVNNLLLRHCIQQQQPTCSQSSSNSQSSASRQLKQTLPTIYNDETTGTAQEDKRRQKEHPKIKKLKDHEERKYLKQSENPEINKSNELHQKEHGRITTKDNQGSTSSKTIYKRESSNEQLDPLLPQRHFIGSTQKTQEQEYCLDKNQRSKIEKNRLGSKSESIGQRQLAENALINNSPNQYEHSGIVTHTRIDNQLRQTMVNDSYPSKMTDRCESDQSINKAEKVQDITNFSRIQQRNIIQSDDTTSINQTNENNQDTDGKQSIHEYKPTGLAAHNKLQNNAIDKRLHRTLEPFNQHEIDYSHDEQTQMHPISQSRPWKGHIQSSEYAASCHNTKAQSQISQMQQGSQLSNARSENGYDSSQQFQVKSMPKHLQIQPILPKRINTNDSRREREISHLSTLSKEDSTQTNDKALKPKVFAKESILTFQSRSPLSQTKVSENPNRYQDFDTYDRTLNHQSISSVSPLSHDELTDNNVNISSSTYGSVNHKQQQLIDGRFVIPSTACRVSSKLNVSSHSSSGHTHPFICTPDFDNSNDNMLDTFSQSTKAKKLTSKTPEIYRLSDRENTQNTKDREKSSFSPLELASVKTSDSSHRQVGTRNESDEIVSNYDSDDGWSDDSAELLYVDERYVTEKRNITSSAHLSSKQTLSYRIQEQDLLLQ